MFTNLFKRGLKKAFDFVPTSHLMTTSAIITAAATTFGVKETGNADGILQMLAMESTDGADMFLGMDNVQKFTSNDLSIESDLCCLMDCFDQCCDL